MGMRRSLLNQSVQRHLIEHFALFLKECEWLFNNNNPKAQLKQLNRRVK